MDSITQSHRSQASIVAIDTFCMSMSRIRSLLDLVSSTALDVDADEQDRLLTLVHCIKRELDDMGGSSPPDSRH